MGTKENAAPPAPRPLVGSGRWVRALETLVWGLPAAFFVAGVVLSDRAREYRLEDAARWLRGERQRGDLIVLGGQISKQHFENVPNVVGAAENPPAVLFPRVFTLFHEKEPARETIAGLRLPAAEHTQAFGPYRITRYRPAKAHFMDWLPKASVRFVRKDGREEPCRGMRSFEFQCPLHGWLKVEPATLKVRDQSYECIAAHPATEGALHLRFPAMPIGPTLFLRTALADTATAPAIRVEARIGDTVVGAIDHKSVPGWEQHDLPTGALAGTTATVELVLSVPSGGRHHFCFSGGT